MGEIFGAGDVAKAELVVACRPPGAAWTASNDAEGLSARSLGSPRWTFLHARPPVRRA